jgi:sugar O-acyltransferase (sialic acid O-acetyltransferase NeuD family)
MKAAFIGFGELGLQIMSLSKSFFAYNETVVFDDQYSQGNFQAFPFLEYSSKKFSDFHFFVCIGYKHLAVKRKIVNELILLGRTLPSLLHPSCHCSKTASIDPGVYVYPMCNIDESVRIKSGALLNNSVTVSHNSVIGEATYLSPGIVISGNVTIGAEVFLGSGTIVGNGLSVHDRAIVGMATNISKDVKEGSHVIGNPMRIVSKISIR